MTRSASGIPVLFLCAVLGVVAGLALLMVHASHNGAHDWRPARTALPMIGGTTAELVFTAELDTDYEIELEFRLGVAKAGIDELVRPIQGPSSLDVHWEVRKGDELVAKGDAAEASYLTGGGEGWLGRTRRTLLQIPFHRIAGGTIERGVGRFAATPGVEYRVTASVGKSVPELEAADPHLAVRVHRRVWQRHYDEMLSVAHAAFCLVLTGAALGVFWLVRRIGRRQRGSQRGGESVEA